MSIKEILLVGQNELRKRKVSEPEKSADFLLRQVLATSPCHSREGGNLDIRAWMLANPDYKLSEKQEDKFREYIERRKKHEPVWYITGKIEFYGLDLEVNQNVLIPRPETEFLVEEVLKSKVDNLRVLELGVGGGAISLALANTLKTKIYASDISGEVLRVAKKNAKNLELEKLIGFRQGDLFEPWKDMKFDIIVANLPYIPHEEMSSLALDIHHWEPRLALDGGKDGLEIYEKLLSQAGDYLNKNSKMFFEIGIEQGEKIEKLAKKYLPNAKVRIKKDYGDIDRIAIIKCFK
jgi:release factor glutamine methyltransferase